MAKIFPKFIPELEGINARLIEVRLTLMSVPFFYIVGLADKALKGRKSG